MARLENRSIQRLRQLGGSLNAIRNLVPGRPVIDALMTHAHVNSSVLSVHRALDALKRSTAFIRLFE